MPLDLRGLPLSLSSGRERTTNYGIDEARRTCDRLCLWTGEQTYSVWAAPTWPVKLCLFVGLVLLAIQAVSEILKHVEGLVTASANGKEAQG